MYFPKLNYVGKDFQIGLLGIFSLMARDITTFKELSEGLLIGICPVEAAYNSLLVESDLKHFDFCAGQVS